MKNKQIGLLFYLPLFTTLSLTSCGNSEQTKSSDIVIHEQEAERIVHADTLSDDVTDSSEGGSPTTMPSDISEGGAGGTKFSLSGVSDTTQWEVAGDSAALAGKKARLKNVVVNAQSDKIGYTLRSDDGTFDMESNEALLEKNVYGVTSEGVKIKTSELYWNPQTQSIRSSSPTTISKDNTTITGTGMRAEAEMRDIELEKDVTVTIKDNDDPKSTRTEITCDGKVEFKSDKNIAVFYENVAVKDTKGFIYCDILEIHFDPDTQEIAGMTAIGNARVVDKNKVTYSEKVEYDKINNTVTWTGNPRIVIYAQGEAPEQHPLPRSGRVPAPKTVTPELPVPADAAADESAHEEGSFSEDDISLSEDAL